MHEALKVCNGHECNLQDMHVVCTYMTVAVRRQKEQIDMERLHSAPARRSNSKETNTLPANPHKAHTDSQTQREREP